MMTMTSRDAVTGRKKGSPHPLNKGKLPPHELDEYMMGEDDEEDEPEDDD